MLLIGLSVDLLICKHITPINPCQAGLVTLENPKQLTIALEPEAASIYCRKLRLRECIPDSLGLAPPSASPSPSTGVQKYSSLTGIPLQWLQHKA